MGGEERRGEENRVSFVFEMIIIMEAAEVAWYNVRRICAVAGFGDVCG